MYLPEGFSKPTHPSNCFELLGFDVLLDDQMKPWLLEVNLCPSLNVETPLDIEIKTKMLVDLFNLVGMQTQEMQAKLLKANLGVGGSGVSQSQNGTQQEQMQAASR